LKLIAGAARFGLCKVFRDPPLLPPFFCNFGKVLPANNNKQEYNRSYYWQCSREPKVISSEQTHHHRHLSGGKSLNKLPENPWGQLPGK